MSVVYTLCSSGLIESRLLHCNAAGGWCVMIASLSNRHEWHDIRVRVLHVSSRYPQRLHICMLDPFCGRSITNVFRITERDHPPQRCPKKQVHKLHGALIKHVPRAEACCCDCAEETRAPPACAGGVGEVDRMMWWSAHSRIRLIWPETRSGPSTVVAYRMGFLMPPLATRPPSGPPSKP